MVNWLYKTIQKAIKTCSLEDLVKKIKYSHREGKIKYSHREGEHLP